MNNIHRTELSVLSSRTIDKNVWPHHQTGIVEGAKNLARKPNTPFRRRATRPRLLRPFRMKSWNWLCGKRSQATKMAYELKIIYFQFGFEWERGRQIARADLPRKQRMICFYRTVQSSECTATSENEWGIVCIKLIDSGLREIDEELIPMGFVS